jgi:hypothetical protein
MVLCRRQLNMNFLGLVLGLFSSREAVAQEERLPPPDDVLGGMPMDYLIGNSNPQTGMAGRITVVAYDINRVPAHGIGVGYCNLFEEAGRTGKYGPYLNDSDTARDYNEGQIDPKGTGWMRNLADQFRRRQKSGFKYIELDNPDAYKTQDVNMAVSMASEYGLGVLAKNPHLCEPDPVSYLAHQNIYGAIVERGAGTARDMEHLRKEANRPNLPVWFVFHGSGHQIADETARIIRSAGYKNMGVTFSRKGEYGTSQDVLLPVKP